MFKSVWFRLYLPHLLYLPVASIVVLFAMVSVIFVGADLGLRMFFPIAALVVTGLLITATWFYLRYYILSFIPSLTPDAPDLQRKYVRMGGLLFYIILAGSLSLWIIGNFLDSSDSMTEYTGWAIFGCLGVAASLVPSLVYVVASMILSKRMSLNQNG
jgi:magnesium-transporting ATPase (P-type)